MRNQQDFSTSLSRLVCESQLQWNDLPGRDGPKCLPDLSSRSSADSLKVLKRLHGAVLRPLWQMTGGTEKKRRKSYYKIRICCRVTEAEELWIEPRNRQDVFRRVRKISKSDYYTNSMTNNFFFLRKSYHFFYYCKAGQATDDNIVHVHYMVDT